MRLEPLALKPEHVEVVRNAMHGDGGRHLHQGVRRCQLFQRRQNRYGAGGRFCGRAKIQQRQGRRGTRDHSLYVAFAPTDNPTIALAVIVENAGCQPGSAAPIARACV